MDRDDYDWDAAFFSLVAPLRPHRYLRAARVAWQTAAAARPPPRRAYPPA